MLIWLIQLLPYFVFSVYQFSLRSPGPPAPLPAVFCPPGVPFGLVHFTNYPLKSEYKEYTLEKILKLDPLACIQSAIRYNQQGLWIFSTPKLFREKFNYLPAYNLSMEAPVTPKPMPASFPNLPTNYSGKLFGIVYITLTGVIDTIIPAASPWSWVGKSASYLLKLAPLLWWALPEKTQPKLPLKTTGQLPKTGSLTTIGTSVKDDMRQLTVPFIFGAPVPAKNNSSFLWGYKAKTAWCAFCCNFGLSWNRSAK
ncbi:hypothetical protein DSO57_1025337 [Entomophthora muscae]|uniref:Uncharacterized protein n=1 Tax=Entomophthora muscae TaxID=34485 RepID=A0ACC2SFD1_9FUNG|nr:hypothetical protein DSO57_1025337 [Entomophthora muscae]